MIFRKTISFFFLIVASAIHIKAQIPAPEIHRVSVDRQSSLPLVYWNYPQNLQADSFIIKRKIRDYPNVIPGSYVTVGTVSGSQNFFLDNSMQYGEAQAANFQEFYKVSAKLSVNDSEQISPLSDAHGTLLFSGNFDYCRKSIHINYDAYSGRNDIASYHLFEKKNENSFLEIASFPPSETFSTPGFEADTLYRLLLQVRFADGTTADAAFQTIKTPKPELPQKIKLLSARVESEQAHISYETETTDAFNGHYLFIAENSGAYRLADSSALSNMLTVNNLNKENDYHCFVAGKNFCGKLYLFSDTLQIPFLKLENQTDFEANFSWNFDENARTELLRFALKDSLIVHTGGSNGHFSEDIKRLYEMQFAHGEQIPELCYRLYAENDKGVKLISNPQCLKPEAVIAAPNSINLNAQREEDRKFRIKLAFVADYKLEIYHESGYRVFSSTSSEEAWDASYPDNSPAPAGTYVYFLSFTDFYGIPHQKKGFITVFR